MTSPKTDPSDWSPNGIIWDGVTEYSDVSASWHGGDRLFASHVRGWHSPVQRSH